MILNGREDNLTAELRLLSKVNHPDMIPSPPIQPLDVSDLREWDSNTSNIVGDVKGRIIHADEFQPHVRPAELPSNDAKPEANEEGRT